MAVDYAGPLIGDVEPVPTYPPHYGFGGITDPGGTAQPLDTDLTAIAALTTTSFGRSILTVVDAAALRTTLGLGTAATAATGAFDAAGAATAAQAAAIAASQPLDADLTAIAALTTTSFGRALLVAADATALRTAAGLGSAAVATVGTAGSELPTNTTVAGLISTASGTAAQKASNLSDLASASTARTNLGLGTAAVLDSGTGSGNLPTKSQVDTLIAAAISGGSSVQEVFYVDLVAFANVSVASSGVPTGSTILLTNQTSSAENGLYDGHTGTALTLASVQPLSGTHPNTLLWAGQDAISLDENRLYLIDAASTLVPPEFDLGATLNAVAALTTTSFGRGLLVLADDAALRAAANLGSMAVQVGSSVSITGGSITGITDVTVADGGTGASTASGARTNLGLVIGTDVQAYDAELAALAGLTSAANKLPYFTGAGTMSLADITASGRALLEGVNASAQRTSLGLGTMALNEETNYVTTTTLASTISGYQPIDSDLTTIMGLTATSDSFMQAKGSAWSARTPAQVRNDLMPVATVSANTTLTAAHGVVLVDASGGAVVITSAAASAKLVHTVKKIDSSANTVTIDPPSTETIDGSLTAVISTPNSARTFAGDGTSNHAVI